MKNLHCTILLSLCVAMIGCSQNLSRGAAKATITASMHFPHAETRLVLARYVWGNGHYRRMPDTAVIDDSVQPEIDFLTKTLMKKSNLPVPGADWSYVWLDFTDQGRQYMVTHGDPYHFNNYHTVKICDLVVSEVTGIQLNGNTAVVEYSLKRTNWTPFGEYYRQKEPDKYPDVIEGQSVEFQKYDDGWRVKQ